ncbi:MAG: hypothetical protein ACR2PG_09450 [Hyphomicrobiaceae bacterium]
MGATFESGWSPTPPELATKRVTLKAFFDPSRESDVNQGLANCNGDIIARAREAMVVNVQVDKLQILDDAGCLLRAEAHRTKRLLSQSGGDPHPSHVARATGNCRFSDNAS